MKQVYNLLLLTLLCLLGSEVAKAQGPPITADKPIMLGSKRKIVKTLTEFRVTDEATFLEVPIMLHYLPTSNTLVALHVPFLSANFNNDKLDYNGLGDINLLFKYQFYRKDGKAKTFRTVAKVLQTFPTGENVGQADFGLGVGQTYLALVAGYETIKHGISNELGYRVVYDKPELNALEYKLGFGLPLLKPAYPVNQLNLYFEYNASYFPQNKDYAVFFAQGIQYAIRQFTFETAIQIPLAQEIPVIYKRKYSLFLGTRFVF